MSANTIWLIIELPTRKKKFFVEVEKNNTLGMLHSILKDLAPTEISDAITFINSSNGNMRLDEMNRTIEQCGIENNNILQANERAFGTSSASAPAPSQPTPAPAPAKPAPAAQAKPAPTPAQPAKPAPAQPAPAQPAPAQPAPARQAQPANQDPPNMQALINTVKEFTATQNETQITSLLRQNKYNHEVVIQMIVENANVGIDQTSIVDAGNAKYNEYSDADKANIQTIMQHGFSRAEAVDVYEACDHNLDASVNILLGSK